MKKSLFIFLALLISISFEKAAFSYICKNLLDKIIEKTTFEYLPKEVTLNKEYTFFHNLLYYLELYPNNQTLEAKAQTYKKFFYIIKESINNEPIPKEVFKIIEDLYLAQSSYRSIAHYEKLIKFLSLYKKKEIFLDPNDPISKLQDIDVNLLEKEQKKEYEKASILIREKFEDNKVCNKLVLGSLRLRDNQEKYQNKYVKDFLKEEIKEDPGSIKRSKGVEIYKEEPETAGIIITNPKNEILNNLSKGEYIGLIYEYNGVRGTIISPRHIKHTVEIKDAKHFVSHDVIGRTLVKNNIPESAFKGAFRI